MLLRRSLLGETNQSPSPTPIHYMPLTTNANDIIGGVVGADTDIDFNSGVDAVFNGTTSNIVYPALLNGRQEFTIRFECYNQNQAQYRAVFGTNPGSPDITGIGLIFYPAALSFLYRLTTGLVTLSVNKNNLPIGAWKTVHIAGYGSRDLSVWFDEDNQIDTPINADFSLNQLFKLGVTTPQSADPGNPRLFSGRMKELKIYDRYLTPSQI